MKRIFTLFLTVLAILTASAKETRTTLYDQTWTCDAEWKGHAQIDNTADRTYAEGDKIVVTVTAKGEAEWPQVKIQYSDSSWGWCEFLDESLYLRGLSSVEEFPYTAEFTLDATMAALVNDGKALIVTGCDYTASKIELVRGEAEPEPTYNYYLVGTLAENGWDAAKATPMENDEITRSVKAGTYEFKVITPSIVDGTDTEWKSALGYDNVDPEASSEGYENNGGNVKVTLNEDGDVTVKVTQGWICLKGKFGEVVVTGYTVAGASDLMGSAWDPADTANDMTQDAESGIWELTKENVTLTAGTYDYKVVGNHAWCVADYPAADNQTLTITEDGKYNVTFTWNPETPELTAKAEKVAEEPEPEGVKLNLYEAEFTPGTDASPYWTISWNDNASYWIFLTPDAEDSDPVGTYTLKDLLQDDSYGICFYSYADSEYKTITAINITVTCENEVYTLNGTMTAGGVDYILFMTSAKNPTTGLNTVASKVTPVDGKFIQNGKVVIVRNGKFYNVNGQAVR